MSPETLLPKRSRSMADGQLGEHVVVHPWLGAPALGCTGVAPAAWIAITRRVRRRLGGSVSTGRDLNLHKTSGDTLMSHSMAIVGSGLIGSSWAAFFLSRNCRVHIFDESASVREAATERVLQMHQTMADHGLSQRASVDRERLLAEMRSCATIAEAVADADWVQESVSETYDAKLPAFSEIDRHAPADAIVASSSSGLLISKLQRVMERPERALIAHPFNPPHLVPLVELAPGERTSPDVVDRVTQQFTQWGKAPVLLRKEIPGHIANRLQAAVWREAIQLVLDGVASVEDVDRALAAGPGIRWALLGPNTIFHLAGGEGGIGSFIDHIGAGWEALWSDMADWKQLPNEAKDTLTAAFEASHVDSAALAAWRDKMLIQILQAVSNSNNDAEDSRDSHR